MLADVRTAEIDTPRVTSQKVLDALQEVTPAAYLTDRGAHASAFYTLFLGSWWIRVEDVEPVDPFLWHIKDDPDSWLYLAASIERPASVEHSIYTRYYDVNQVRAIYVQSLPEVRNVFVLLIQDHYDDELMDRLLDREEEILDLYLDELFNFQYLPLLENDHTRPVPKNAVLILSR